MKLSFRERKILQVELKYREFPLNIKPYQNQQFWGENFEKTSNINKKNKKIHVKHTHMHKKRKKET